MKKYKLTLEQKAKLFNISNPETYRRSKDRAKYERYLKNIIGFIEDYWVKELKK
jgi:hypothetical protein